MASHVQIHCELPQKMYASTSHTIDSSGTDDEHDSSQPCVKRSKVWQFFEQDLVMVDDVWKAHVYLVLSKVQFVILCCE